MKKRKYRGLLVTSIVSVFFLSIFSLSSAAFAPVIPGNAEAKALDIDNQQIRAYFNKIAATPYNTKENNCKSKAEQFADYLVKHGATGVNTVEIQYKDGKQFHESVEWHGKIYDPTIPVYAMDENEYFNLIKSYGLIGLKFITPYK